MIDIEIKKTRPEDRKVINKFLFIDGQYYLTRNWAWLKSRDELNVKNLIELTFKSISKIQDVVAANNIVLLWDTYPYNKTEELKNAGVDYKGNREFALDRIKEIERLLETETSPDILEQLNKELEEKKKDHEAFLIRSEVKGIFKEWMPEIGIGSLNIKGLEADDLACLAAIYTDKCDIVNIDRSEKTVICSSDSDWLSFLSPKTDFYRTTKISEFLSYRDAPLKIPKKYRGLVNLYEYNLLHVAYYGDHNNILKDEETRKVSFDIVIKKYVNGEISDMPRVEKIFNALNVVKYYNKEIEDKFNDVCMNIKPLNFGAFIDFCAKYDLELTEFFYTNLEYYLNGNRKSKN